MTIAYSVEHIMSSVRDARDYLTATDMDVLDIVHTRLCAQRFLLKDSMPSIRIAVRLIKLFQMGETDPDRLFDMFQRKKATSSFRDDGTY